MSFRTVLPAGEYWIGDVCYAFNENSPVAWEDVLADTDFFEKSNGCYLPGISLWAVGTRYGDGSYPSNLGKIFPVDSGLIGIMSVPTTEFLKSDKDRLEKNGSFVSFDEPFNVSFNDGNFEFGHLCIYTGDEQDLDEDEFNKYYEED